MKSITRPIILGATKHHNALHVRMSFAIAVIQGKIYCIGGRNVAGDMSGGYTSVNEVYDPVTNSWENKAPMPIANGWIDAKVIDSRIYIKNYIPSTSSGLYDVYDPASDTWNSSGSQVHKMENYC